MVAVDLAEMKQVVRAAEWYMVFGSSDVHVMFSK
jgi:hypothetical protein